MCPIASFSILFLFSLSLFFLYQMTRLFLYVPAFDTINSVTIIISVVILRFFDIGYVLPSRSSMLFTQTNKLG
jgi:hypothetical protein